MGAADKEFMPAEDYGRTLQGLGVNLLVRDVPRSVAFARDVLGASVAYADKDFAVLRYANGPTQAEWMLHADGTYHSNPLLGLIGDASVLWIFAVLFGIFDYATVPPTASLAAGHLGKARVGTAMGLISAGHSIGAAMGAFMGGYLFDTTGGYGWLWSSSFGLALAAAGIAAVVPSAGIGNQGPVVRAAVSDT